MRFLIWQIGKFGKYPQSKIHRKATNLCVRFIQIMRVKHWSHKFVLHKTFIMPYVTIHKALECVNKNCINLSRGPF